MKAGAKVDVVKGVKLADQAGNTGKTVANTQDINTKKESIIEEGPGDPEDKDLIQERLDQAEAKRVELQHRDGKGALFKVDEDIIYVSNSDIERLEQVRKQREQNAKEREIEKAKADALKAKQQADLLKLQENLALKHKKGRR